jgi:hypothetical protein
MHPSHADRVSPTSPIAILAMVIDGSADSVVRTVIAEAGAETEASMPAWTTTAGRPQQARRASTRAIARGARAGALRPALRANDGGRGHKPDARDMARAGFGACAVPWDRRFSSISVRSGGFSKPIMDPSWDERRRGLPGGHQTKHRGGALALEGATVEPDGPRSIREWRLAPRITRQSVPSGLHGRADLLDHLLAADDLLAVEMS